MTDKRTWDMAFPSAPIVGEALIERIKRLGNLPKDSLIASCGYYTGKYPHATVRNDDQIYFYEELILAKDEREGMTFSEWISKSEAADFSSTKDDL